MDHAQALLSHAAREGRLENESAWQNEQRERRFAEGPVEESQPQQPDYHRPHDEQDLVPGPVSADHHALLVPDTYQRDERPVPAGGRSYPAAADASGSNKKARLSAPSAATNGTSEGDTKGARRAAQACLRCRRQKLRCLGGWPCDRCSKAKLVCDFGQTSGLGAGTRGAGGVGGVAAEANARLQQLESSVATLLAGLSGGSKAEALPAPGGIYGEAVDPSSFEQRLSGASGALAPFLTPDGQPNLPPLSSWRNDIPPPLHVPLVEPPKRVDTTTNLSASTLSPAEQQHVRFTSSPHMVFSAPSATSPSNAASATSSGISPMSALGVDGKRNKEKKMGRGQKAEERLAAATEGAFEPPFRALVYQPAVWDNKEQSRRSSPQPSGEAMSRDEQSSMSYDRRYGRDQDDPINTGLVDLVMAQTLYNFFVEHCHPFMPIVNVGLPDAFSSIRQSPFLTSAILAVAARFYIKHHARTYASTPPLPIRAPLRLANLAEAHLGQTLLRKQHALSDVQAILLLAAWGLQAGGRGPDAWIVTGHAARVSRRLGVHQALALATETARRIDPNSADWAQLEAFSPKWRTWLAWFCFDGLLSLGFGRPQSTQFETVDEEGFLQLRLSQLLPRPGSSASVALYGDMYIAGQVQLTQIGRDLVNWCEMLADPDKAILADPRRGGMFKNEDLNVRSMFRELNKRVDDWSKLWVWSGSPYTLYLGSSARIARLQAEHMRLCLNSFALKSRPDTDEFIGQCLKKALLAAQSTIQTHFDSSQTDLALSFATDYLTITLAQAAVFLIRITKSPPAVQAVLHLDSSVVAHYLKMSVDVLEGADMSETRLSTYLAKTIREIARAGGIPGLASLTPTSDRPTSGGLGEDFGREGGMDSTLMAGGTGAGAHGMSQQQPMPPMNEGEPFDLGQFLQFESQLDLGYLLGLPGDAHGPGQGGDGMGGMSFFGDYDFGAMGAGDGQGQALGANGVDQGGAGPSDGAVVGGAQGGWNDLAQHSGLGEFEFGMGFGTGGAGLSWMGLGRGESQTQAPEPS